MTVRYVTVDKFAEDSGYTSDAIRNKIQRGVWIEGRQFVRAPDNRTLIDTIGVEKWVEGQREPLKQGQAA